MKRRVILFLAALFSYAGAVFAHEGHEHASNLPVNVKWGLEGAKELTNLHPLFTHFPIALLLISLVFYLLGLIFKKDHFLKSGQWALYFGTLGAAAAVWTGLQAANTVSHDGSSHPIMMAHQYLGITVLVLSAILSAWLIVSKSSVPRPKPVFIGGLLLIAALLIQQVDFGGQLVFFHGVGMGRKSVMLKAQTESHEHDHAEASH